MIVDGLQVNFVTRHDTPLLEGAVAYFVTQVIETHLAGDHTLYIGRVEHFEWCEARPLLFYADIQHIHPKKSKSRR